MTEQLDRFLVAKVRRSPRFDGGLTLEERIAVNLLWSGEGDPLKRKIRVPVLMEVFQCGKNSIYATCLTGRAKSYVNGRMAQEVRDAIDAIGVKAARAKYLTDPIIRAVNAINRRFAKAA